MNQAQSIFLKPIFSHGVSVGDRPNLKDRASVSTSRQRSPNFIKAGSERMKRMAAALSVSLFKTDRAFDDSYHRAMENFKEDWLQNFGLDQIQALGAQLAVLLAQPRAASGDLDPA